MKKGSMRIDYSSSFAAAVCIGPFPGFLAPEEDYASEVARQLSLFDQIAALFQKKRLGREYDRKAENIRLICRFPLESRETFAGTILQPVLKKAEELTGTKLLCGIGLPAANQLHLEESLATSEDAFHLYFFENGSFFESQKHLRKFSLSFEEYEQYSENAFKSILMKSPDAIHEIDSCIDLIRRIHYGNKSAVIMRAMNFTGETAYRLHRYNFLEGDFYHLQDTLQKKVLAAQTFEEMKAFIHEYYVDLLSEIYAKSHTGRKTMIEQVKTYIQENYMEELTVADMADIACVSQGYFSHMFRNETGGTFKAYLTDVRMKAATELLSVSDYRLYEISEKVGYRNVRNFLEAFHKKFGMAPSEYRKRSRSSSL